MGAWISVCIVLIIFIAVSVYIYRHRLLQKELEREIMMRDLDALKARISEIQATDRNASRDGQDDDVHLLEILKSICDWQSVYSLRNGQSADFTLKVSELLTDDDNFHILEQYIDRNYDNLMTRFRHQAGALNERQFRIAGFLFLGFSDTTIASLFHISTPAVRQLRYRIRKKLKENPNPDMDLFLGYF